MYVTNVYVDINFNYTEVRGKWIQKYMEDNEYKNT